MADTLGYFKIGTDVFANTGGGTSSKIDQPTFQSLGLNYNLLGEGLQQTKTLDQLRDTETKQFISGGGILGAPNAGAIAAGINIPVKDEVPNAALEANITRADIDKMFSENQRNFQSSLEAQTKANQELFNQTLAKMQLSPEEKLAQERLLGLRQLQDEAVQRVQERPLDGTVLRAGLESEIQNITTGQTRESLVNLRKQQFEAERLNLLTSQRNQELESLKLQMDQGNINTDNLFKAQSLLQENQRDYLDRVQTLTENARTSLATILDRFQGLTLDKISGESLKTITMLAAQAGIPLDILRDGMKTIADQIAWEQKQAEYEAQTARISKLASDQKTTTANQSLIESLNTKLINIGNLIDHPGMTGTVGAYGIARWTPLTIDKAAKTDFIAGVEQLVSQDTLNTLINLKAQGGTLGALSDQERVLLQSAASKIGTWRLTDKDTGKVYGYETSEANFKKELGELQRLAKLAIQRAGGTTNLGQDDINEINTIFGVGGTSGSSFDPSTYFK
jgi:hypothetical protein